MRGLIFTLYAGVFLALLGLGWGIDRYYDSVVQNEKTLPYPGYHAALNLVSDHVSTLINKPEAAKVYLSRQSLELSLEPVNSIPLPTVLSERRDQGKVIILESETGISLHHRIGTSDWILTLELPPQVPATDQQIRFWLTLFFYLGVAAILLLWLTPLLRGIQQLTRAAKSIGQGALETRVDNPDGIYLRPLKTQFNAMAERLQRLNENNRLLSQAVSHELRTPLSRLRFALDLLETRVDPQQRSDDMKRMENDLDAMEALINELLNYARLDSEPTLTFQNIEVEEIIQQRIEQRYEKSCSIKFEPNPPNQKLSVDPDYLCKVIDNLIQNACRHANSEVFVRTNWVEKNFEIHIEDDGPGIPPDQKEDIFKPFIRMLNNDNKRTSGFGLGLAIAQRIVNWHQGSIAVTRSETLGGAQFSVTIPGRLI